MTDRVPLFLLTREARSTRDGFELVIWGWSESGPVEVRVSRHEASFFVTRNAETQAGRRVPTELRTLSGVAVDELFFGDRNAMRAESDRLRGVGTPGFETDVKPIDQALMRRGITGSCEAIGRLERRKDHCVMRDPELRPLELRPRLKVASFDVEAEGPNAPLISVGIVCGDEERAFVRGQGPPIAGVSYFPDERRALEAFLDYVARLDPDVLIGWNVIAFDVAYLEGRCRRVRLPFRLGRAGGIAKVLTGTRASSPAVAIVPGRVVLDGIATMRAATWSFERWSLEHVGRKLLGRGKKIAHGADGDRLQEIVRMYNEDLPALLEYNLEDCRLVRDIFETANVLEFAIERQRLTGLTMDRRAGAVSAFDLLYLPRLHAAGRVAPSIGVTGEALASPGGMVMDSVPGLYDNVLVFDFKSLYPSLIRTFLVDPLGLATASDDPDPVPGFAGARFHRTQHILPSLIEGLWRARDRAKQQKDEALSRAIKIQMNSFYGVLGSPGCRFFDPRLASSITRRGHEVLEQTSAWIRERGLRVIYGDTDSLFVHLGSERDADACRALGRALTEELNAAWRDRILEAHGLESRLELQFETHFTRFLMPTMRGSETGSKKRYAGLVTTDAGAKVQIKGLEAVRTDWTPLARRFQRELIRRVFVGEPFAAWIRELTDRLYKGELDEDLVYHKRLTRDLDEYTRNVPPHVVAARQLEGARSAIDYVITTRGPQPTERLRAPIDYEHYLHKQLAPVADVVLPFVGEDFLRLGGRQLSLF
ncbi:MAG: DNA polymerase II [Sandaracinaceae bacterium]